jgi:hypothetical protein
MVLSEQGIPENTNGHAQESNNIPVIAHNIGPIPVYSTTFHISLLQTEAHLLFGRLRPIIPQVLGEATTLLNEFTVSVVVSPIVLKDIAKRLNDTIAAYEAANGSIPELKL